MEDTKPTSTVPYSRIFLYFWRETKGYRLKILISLMIIGVATLLANAIEPKAYERIIDILSTAEVPAWTEALATAVLFLAGVLFGSFVLWRVSEYLQSYIQSKISKHLTDLAFQKTIIHSRRFFADNFTGGLVAKAGRFVGAFENIYDIIIWHFFASFLGFAGIIFILWKESAVLTLLFVSWFIIFIGISYFFAKYKAPFDEERATASSTVRSWFSDAITNILSVKIFSAGSYEMASMEEKTTDEERKRLRSWYVNNAQNLVQGFLMFILEIAGLYIAIRLWVRGEVGIGFVILVQMYMVNIFHFIGGIGYALRRFASSLSDAKEMIEIFETPIDITDPRDPESCGIKDGRVEFQNVSFEYKEGKDVFQGFNLLIPPGQKVGIVGHSGSGKTTITNLLLRFEDVTGGAILIDGQDIRRIRQDDLRRNISYVPQEPLLFHRSLRENIAYGKSNVSKQDVMAAAKKAHADEFIRELKDGYDTLVGERGVKLSGGQRQRVAIARVMLEHTPILILDEATSSLDSISEHLIQKAFDEAMKGRTTIVIAHRLSTIQKMDRIIVLDKGIVVEDGRHEDLLQKKGYYWKLWQAQKDGII